VLSSKQTKVKPKKHQSLEKVTKVGYI